jgi:hypothetical protein
MSFLPHPVTMAKLAEQRRREFHAAAEQARLVSVAQPHDGRRHQPWPDLSMLRGVATTLAVVLAALHRG